MKQVIATLLALFFTVYTFGQNNGKGEIVRQETHPGSFNAIKISGAANAVLMNGDDHSVVIETNAGLINDITIVLNNETLSFDFNKLKSYKVLNLYITSPEFNKIVVSGASDAKSDGTLKGSSLKVISSGASDVTLNLDYESVSTNASGASDIRLEGQVVSHVAKASGASDIIAKNLITETTVVNASGASSCFVNAATSLTYQVSGSSTVKYVGTPATLVVTKGNTEKVVVQGDTQKVSTVHNYGDTTTVHLGAFDVEVVDGDTTKVSVGRHTLIVDDDGNVKYVKNKRNKFNGHWGGVEIGINGYVTPDFNTNFGTDYDYLTLRYEKSIAVNLNVYEQNISLNKAKNIGLVTGIGMAWNNYRFSQQTYLTPDSAKVYGFYIDGASVRKTKLTAMYITVPVMFEVQTKNPNRYKRFHFAVGGLISARVRTHTKIYFNNPNQEYKLYDPVTSSYAPGVYVTPNQNTRNIIKNYNSFYLQPFKFDAMVRIGYSVINVFATYSLNTLFQSDRGPKLYAWTAGITLVGW